MAPFSRGGQNERNSAHLFILLFRQSCVLRNFLVESHDRLHALEQPLRSRKTLVERVDNSAVVLTPPPPLRRGRWCTRWLLSTVRRMCYRGFGGPLGHVAGQQRAQLRTCHPLDETAAAARRFFFFFFFLPRFFCSSIFPRPENTTLRRFVRAHVK